MGIRIFSSNALLVKALGLSLIFCPGPAFANQDGGPKVSRRQVLGGAAAAGVASTPVARFLTSPGTLSPPSEDAMRVFRTLQSMSGRAHVTIETVGLGAGEAAGTMLAAPTRLVLTGAPQEMLGDPRLRSLLLNAAQGGLEITSVGIIHDSTAAGGPSAGALRAAYPIRTTGPSSGFISSGTKGGSLDSLAPTTPGRAQLLPGASSSPLSSLSEQPPSAAQLMGNQGMSLPSAQAESKALAQASRGGGTSVSNPGGAGGQSSSPVPSKAAGAIGSSGEKKPLRSERPVNVAPAQSVSGKKVASAGIGALGAGLAVAQQLVRQLPAHCSPALNKEDRAFLNSQLTTFGRFTQNCQFEFEDIGLNEYRVKVERPLINEADAEKFNNHLRLLAIDSYLANALNKDRALQDIVDASAQQWRQDLRRASDEKICPVADNGNSTANMRSIRFNIGGAQRQFAVTLLDNNRIRVTGAFSANRFPTTGSKDTQRREDFSLVFLPGEPPGSFSKSRIQSNNIYLNELMSLHPDKMNVFGLMDLNLDFNPKGTYRFRRSDSGGAPSSSPQEGDLNGETDFNRRGKILASLAEQLAFLEEIREELAEACFPKTNSRKSSSTPLAPESQSN